jgi:hypothetical protein
LNLQHNIFLWPIRWTIFLSLIKNSNLSFKNKFKLNFLQHTVCDTQVCDDTCFENYIYSKQCPLNLSICTKINSITIKWLFGNVAKARLWIQPTSKRFLASNDRLEILFVEVKRKKILNLTFNDIICILAFLNIWYFIKFLFQKKLLQSSKNFFCYSKEIPFLILRTLDLTFYPNNF